MATHALAPPARRPALRALAIRWHQALALLGGLALLLWGGSGLLHPIISTFGPQQAVFLPPERPIDLSGIRPIPETLAAAGIAEARAIRIAPGPSSALLQVTTDPDRPRRWFRLEDGAELPGHDRAQAIFLARHWMALPDTPVRSVTWVDRFSADYPAVNRLLPVWLVTFDRPDNLAVRIHTETGAVAAVTNGWKTTLQRAFQWLHSWSFLPREAEWVRILLIALLVGALLALVVTGTAMLALIRRTRRAPGRRGWHRIAGYALALPLLMFSTSGLFHLVQNGWAEPTRTLTLSPPLRLAPDDFGLHEQWATITDGLAVTGVSLVEAADGTRLYRIALAPDRSGAPATPQAIRNARFDGVQPTGSALYLDARTGLPWAPGDRELALQLGERFTGVPRSAIRHAELVTRFGPAYDFRNKRLPVWRLDYGPPVNATLFVDTATGVLADRTPDSAKAERWSFSMLHKWNFLFPLGRQAQNAIVSAAVLLSIGLMAGIGLSMELKRRRARRGRSAG
ncbi:MAG: PepSY domain-containing protein [Sphingomonadaceae bacterium]